VCEPFRNIDPHVLDEVVDVALVALQDDEIVSADLDVELRQFWREMTERLKNE
jgi:hypothetical protein